jgi:hypothetical protein
MRLEPEERPLRNRLDPRQNHTGAIDPVNTNQLFPDAGGDNFNVPHLSFTQFVSPYFGVLAGKLDTMSSDENEFAHGKCDTQFMNLAFNINPVTVVAAPYSPLGAANPATHQGPGRRRTQCRGDPEYRQSQHSRLRSH